MCEVSPTLASGTEPKNVIQVQNNTIKITNLADSDKILYINGVSVCTLIVIYIKVFSLFLTVEVKLSSLLMSLEGAHMLKMNLVLDNLQLPVSKGY